MSIAEDFKWKMYTVDEFSLIVRVLRADPKNLETERLEFLMQVTKTAGMRSATTRTGNQVPFLRDRLMRLGVAGIKEEDRRRSGAGKINTPSCRASK